MTDQAVYPLRVFDRPETVAIFDAEDREVVFWTGFDASRIGLAGARALAYELVEAANAANADRRRESVDAGERWNRRTAPEPPGDDVREELVEEVESWISVTVPEDPRLPMMKRVLARLRSQDRR